MVVFLIALLPLSYWALQYIFDNDNVRMRDRLIPFFSGVALAIPVILMQWAVDIYFPLRWSAAGIYFHCFFNKEAFMAYPVLIFLFLVFRKKEYSGTALRELSTWLFGYYFFISLSEALILRSAFDGYGSVLLPMIRLFSVLIFSMLLVRSLQCVSANMKIVNAVLLFILPLVLNMLPVLNVLRKTWILAALLSVYAVISMVLYYLESRGRFS